MSITAPTAAQLHAIAEHALATPNLPDSDILQLHDLCDASAGDCEGRFAPLIEHCAACGQPLPDAVVE